MKLTYANSGKRVLDIVVSLALLPLLILITFPVSILIKLDDGGKVFYLADRYGKGMKKFKMIKFRSMKTNSPDLRNSDGTTFNSDNDPRLTRVGRYLRKLSIDEVPQLFNVLIGDMSLIGPRPSPMGNEKTYTNFVKQKFKVRPGITGYNQALKRNQATLEERYENDVFYSENCKFSLDCKILLMTIVTVLKMKNIYRN